MVVRTLEVKEIDFKVKESRADEVAVEYMSFCPVLVHESMSAF